MSKAFFSDWPPCKWRAYQIHPDVWQIRGGRRRRFFTLCASSQSWSSVGVNAHFAEAGGHMDGAEEILHSLDAEKGGFIVGQTEFHAHDVMRKADEARHAVLIDIARPTAPDGGETRAVRHVKHAAQLMLQTVGSKIALAVAAAGQAVMRKAACPHDLGARGRNFGIVAEDERLRHDGAQQASAMLSVISIASP